MKRARGGDLDTVRRLIAAGPASVDADDERGWRPIFHAGLWRHEEIGARLLIEAGADLAAHDGYVMHYAGEVPNNKAIVVRLVQSGPWMPMCDRRMICRDSFCACFSPTRAGSFPYFARHPHLAGTPDGRGDQPIHHAARNGDTEVVRLLIERRGRRQREEPPWTYRVILCRGSRSPGYIAVASECGKLRRGEKRAARIPCRVSRRLPLHADRRGTT